jgi:heme A synthase
LIETLQLWSDRLVTVHTGNRERDRRGRLLNVILTGMIGATTVLFLLNSVQLVFGMSPHEPLLHFAISDVLIVALLLGLMWMNRRGWTPDQLPVSIRPDCRLEHHV